MEPAVVGQVGAKPRVHILAVRYDIVQRVKLGRRVSGGRDDVDVAYRAVRPNVRRQAHKAFLGDHCANVVQDEVLDRPGEQLMHVHANEAAHAGADPKVNLRYSNMVKEALSILFTRKRETRGNMSKCTRERENQRRTLT